jgi:hypothetical protein
MLEHVRKHAITARCVERHEVERLLGKTVATVGP